MISIDKKVLSDAVRLAEEHRAYLHTIPERAFEEYKTTEYIKKVCEGYPVEIIDIGMETGLVCFLDAGCKDTIALRTDIDSVPTEQGQEHLCGHDAHTASMLAAIHCLCNGRDGHGDRPPGQNFTGPAGQGVSPRGQNVCPPGKHNVLFIFQPGEEGTRGARAMLDHGLLDKVPQKPSMIFGIHNRPEADCGDVIVHKGPLMSEKSVFDIRLTGKAGHGSLPHKCIDPIVAAGSLICGVQTIISRNTDPFEPAICTFNSVSAGMSESSAPETARLTGYIRSLGHETHSRLCERLTELAQGTAGAYECKCDVKITHMVPAVVNSEEMYKKALRAAEAAAGKDHITDSAPSLASEDFAVFGEKIPSFLFWVGSGTPGRDNAPWHDPGFRIDPHYFETAVPLLCACAEI